MNEIKLNSFIEKYENDEYTVVIVVEESPYDNILYKYIIGYDGKWETIRSFTNEKKITCKLKSQGDYIVMVQAKRENSTKSFDYVSRYEFKIGDINKNLIREIKYEDKLYNIGDKLKIEVDTYVDNILLRYWVYEEDNWNLIKDYSNDRKLNWTIRKGKEQEILVESKEENSTKNFEDSKKIRVSVEELETLQIENLKCLSPDLIKGKELTFQVSSNFESKRKILYKFVKIKDDGEVEIVQDYSTKKIVSFIEKIEGSYKLLCYAKDMYSVNSYDDRALLNYNVLSYVEIKIISFTTDNNSPSPIGRSVNFKPIVIGGESILYKYIIVGSEELETSFTKVADYEWIPRRPGEYEISLLVKDESYRGEFEKKETIKYIIDEYKGEIANIESVEMSKEEGIVCDDNILIKVFGGGSKEIRYSFVVKRNDIEIDRITYGTCNYTNFKPIESGLYNIDIMVKDKFSEKEYDAHVEKFIQVRDFREAYIDHILIPVKDRYLIGEIIDFDIIIKNTKDVLIKYILKINGHKVEEIDYKEASTFKFTPAIKGEYVIEFFAKNKKSDKNFDSKKEVKINVIEALPITNTKIYSDKVCFKSGDTVTVKAECQGGRDVLYEFYIMEKGDWNLVSKYSKRNYYSFVTYSKGNIPSKYEILVLTKSEGNNSSYEDYDSLEIDVY